MTKAMGRKSKGKTAFGAGWCRFALIGWALAGCGGEPAAATDAREDASADDATATDGAAADAAGAQDTGGTGDTGADAGVNDAIDPTPNADAGAPDVAAPDTAFADSAAGQDAGDSSPSADAVTDAASDADANDTTAADAAATDAGTSDTTTDTAATDAGSPALNQVPPTGAPLLAWLQAGNYAKWAAEPDKHASAGPHFGGVRAFFNAALTASLASGGNSHPVGAAAVKELYGSGNKVIGWAVMVKTAAPSAGASWYWYEHYQGQKFADGNGTALCTGCHTPGKDYVLSKGP